jgi:hypothetical protein
VIHVAEQTDDTKSDSCEKKACEACKKEEKEEPDMDEFDKKWADIEYLIRRQFCCK